MAITAFTGPVLSFGLANVGSSIPSEYNSQRGPSLFDLGYGLADPRPGYNYVPGNGPSNAIYGFPPQGAYVSLMPAAPSSNGIAASQTSTGNAALTLTATGAGITTVSITAPETGRTVSNLLAIDGAAGGSTFGSDNTVSVWNPATLSARCLTFVSTANDSGGAYTVIGRDVYGYKMTETLAGGNNAQVTTQKAFKYIASITSSGTIASTGILVGYGNTFGFPWYVGAVGHTTIWGGANSSAVQVVVSSGITFGSTRATQTSTTPDVRGTWNSTLAGGAAPDGTSYLLYMGVTLAPSRLATVTSTNFSGIFGAAQFSSV